MIFKKRQTNYFILIILFMVAIWVWLVVFTQVPDNLLEVIFFDVGQGDAIFIETPNNQQVLIDGGPDRTILEKLNQTMPFYDRTIDLIISTHPDADHLTGLVEVLKYYQVNHILTSGLEKDTVIYQKWRELIEQKGIPLTLAQAGQKVILQTPHPETSEQKELVLEIFWPEQLLIESFSKPTNNVSVVGRLVYGEIEFLLPGDIEKKIEQYLINQGWDMDSDILKIAHHGSKTSSSYNFLKVVSPEAVVISVGEKNRYKHPSKEVLEELEDLAVYRTDKNGDIEILTDGRLFKIKVKK
jgi:competence protein ComEC